MSEIKSHITVQFEKAVVEDHKIKIQGKVVPYYGGRKICSVWLTDKESASSYYEVGDNNEVYVFGIADGSECGVAYYTIVQDDANQDIILLTYEGKQGKNTREICVPCDGFNRSGLFNRLSRIELLSRAESSDASILSALKSDMYVYAEALLDCKIITDSEYGAIVLFCVTGGHVE